MRITDYFTVTELSRLTKKTRPTIYKYMNEYQRANYDEVPYSIMILFDMILSSNIPREKIIQYCSEKFGNDDNENAEIKEIVQLIYDHYEEIDLNEIKEFIKERINVNGKK